ncbi:MAG: hypothetical protein JSR60_05200 [Proteobacteria bacterium]|nr:hypothetical protein [Pseudomonadota bacterium]
MVGILLAFLPLSSSASSHSHWIKLEYTGWRDHLVWDVWLIERGRPVPPLSLYRFSDPANIFPGVLVFFSRNVFSQEVRVVESLPCMHGPIDSSMSLGISEFRDGIEVSECELKDSQACDFLASALKLRAVQRSSEGLDRVEGLAAENGCPYTE